MGYSIEYFVALPRPEALRWISSIPGSWVDNDTDGFIACGEFDWREKSVLAWLGPTACSLTVPTNYSWLIAEHAPTVEWVIGFESWLTAVLPEIRKIRVDELLKLNWESETGREWDSWEDPTEAIGAWLLSTDQDPEYFRMIELGNRRDGLTNHLRN